jgi:hypothetical protein
MNYQLKGTPTSALPEVLASGHSDVSRIFTSMAARESNGRDADYLAWHSLDHRPEQYRIAGLRHSIRLVSTPACRAARAFSDPAYDAVDHVMTYFFSEHAAFDQYAVLSKALGGDRRPFRLPTINANYYKLAGKAASDRAVAGADVIPWRPARGVYLILEQGEASPADLCAVEGVAGVWWHCGGTAPVSGFSDNSGLQLSYCFMDGEPLATAERLRGILEKRWATSTLKPLLAAPFHILAPFEWDKHLP